VAGVRSASLALRSRVRGAPGRRGRAVMPSWLVPTDRAGRLPLEW
jgi:hypothetical protein